MNGTDGEEYTDPVEETGNASKGRSGLRLAFPVLVILLGIGVLYPMQRLMDNTYPHEVIGDETLYLSSGKTIKKLSVGLDALVGDIYWIRTVQYFGGKLLAAQGVATDTSKIRMDLLAPLLNIVVTLDPHDVAPYRFGALFLPDRYPNQAVALLKDGIENNPNAWRLYQDLGYIYWHQGQYEEAAAVYDKGSTLPGARYWMHDLAGLMRIRGGTRDAARNIYIQYLDSDDKNIRVQAEKRLTQLDALDQMDFLNAVLAAYVRKFGSCPKDLSAIAREAASRRIKLDPQYHPVDPLGFPYALNAAECKVELALNSEIPR